MLKLITAKSSILLPGGIIKRPEETFMCDSSFADKLIAAGNAVENKMESIQKDDSFKKITAGEAIILAISDKTIKQLEAIAESNGIDIDKSLTKKEDIFNAVKEGLVKIYAEKDL